MASAPVFYPLGLVGKPEPSDIEYRYYHCTLAWEGMKCAKVNGAIYPIKENTKLLFVRSVIPEDLDKVILKHKWMPSSVEIQ